MSREFIHPLMQADIINYKLAIKLKYPTESRTKVIEALNSIPDKAACLIHELEEYHPGTYCHSIDVSKLTVDLGIENNCQDYFDGQGLIFLAQAGLIHDLGKMHVPKEILTKPGKLTQEEFEKIMEHARRSYVDAENAGVSPLILEVMMMTHECKKDKDKNYPRNGYDRRNDSRRESKERRHEAMEIKELGQIVAISDIAVALREKRDYHEPMSKEKVREILYRDFSGDEKLILQALERCIDWEYEAVFDQ